MAKAARRSGRRLHFVGIGGAGMSGLALVARALGAEVTGSDRAESAYTARLREHGIEPAIGHDARQLPEGAEVVYSTAVPAENPERAAARELGLPEIHRGALLGEVTRLRRTIAVAGTHGKTTTTSMIAHALRGAGLDPGYVIGGELRSTGLNAEWGSGEWLVVEADESDRSFLELSPEIAVLTNLELDHHTTYASRLELAEAVRAFLAPAEQAVIADEPALLALRGERPAVPFSAPPADLDGGGSAFSWEGVAVRLTVPGEHNVLNAVAALEACTLAGADPAAAAEALQSFTGAGRRFERLGATAAGAEVYDDYAHHPTEVARRARGRAHARAAPRRRRSSSLTSTRARRCSGATSARRSPPPTWRPSSTSTRPASGRGLPRGHRPARGRGGRGRGRRAPGLLAARARRRRARAAGRPARRRSLPDARGRGRGRARKSAGGAMSERPAAVQPDYPLARLTTVRTGGPAEFFARAGSEEALRELLAWAAGEGLEVGVVGSGSNLLVADDGVRGLVVKLDGPWRRSSRTGRGCAAAAAPACPSAAAARRARRPHRPRVRREHPRHRRRRGEDERQRLRRRARRACSSGWTS